LRALIAIGWGGTVCERHTRSVYQAVDENALATVGYVFTAPCTRGKTSYPQRRTATESVPRSSPSPKRRACMAASVPSACQRCSHRSAVLFGPHSGLSGRSHDREPVTSTYSDVFTTLRDGVGGIPRPLLLDSGGKMLAKSCHSKSLCHSAFPSQ
jgi:hypothetical protein